MNPAQAARLLGGTLSAGIIRCPGPGHSTNDNSLAVWLSPDGVRVHSHAGDDWRDCLDHVRAALGELPHHAPVTRPVPLPGKGDNFAFAMRIWNEGRPMLGTLAEKYFRIERSIDLSALPDVSHAVRYHDASRCVVALMTDPFLGTGAVGIHRTFLNADGTKHSRKMLGRAGVVRLSPDDAVEHGLGITEGLEDGLTVMRDWKPIWAATSAGAIAKFPVLSGIDALTIFADFDFAGMKAARSCAVRWLVAGREARIVSPEAMQG